MCSVSGFLNPAGYIASRVGGVGGAIIDPVGTIAKKVGGPVGHFLDPAAATGKLAGEKNYGVDEKKKQAQQTAPEAKSSTLLTKDQPKSQTGKKTLLGS